MVCKSASPLVRLGVAAVSWAVAAWFAESTLGPDIGRASRRLEQRIEMQLKKEALPAPPPVQPERSHEEAIEPWELVGV
jgi:hypothetical protein